MSIALLAPTTAFGENAGFVEPSLLTVPSQTDILRRENTSNNAQNNHHPDLRSAITSLPHLTNHFRASTTKIVAADSVTPLEFTPALTLPSSMSGHAPFRPRRVVLPLTIHRFIKPTLAHFSRPTGIPQSAASPTSLTIPALNVTGLGRSLRSINLPAKTPTPIFASGAGNVSAHAAPAIVAMSQSQTGIKPWWDFNRGTLPGIGTYSINVASTNLVIQPMPDMSIPHHGVPLIFARTFNAMSGRNYSGSDGSGIGQYGNGWTNTFDAHIALNASGGISVFDSTGARHDYALPAGASGLVAPQKLVPPAGMEGTSLVTYDGGSYYWTAKSGETQVFYGLTYPASKAALNGRPYQFLGRNRNASLTFYYYFDSGNSSSNANLNEIAVHTDYGTQVAMLQFSNVTVGGSTERLLTSLTYPDDVTKVSYFYDNYGNLAEVVKPGNNANSSRPEYYTVYTDPPNGVRLDASGGNCNSGVSFTLPGTTSLALTTPSPLSDVLYYGFANFTPPDGLNTVLQPAQPAGNQNIRNIQLYNNAGGVLIADSDNHQTQYFTDSLGRLTEVQSWSNGAYGGAFLKRDVRWDAHNNLTASIDERNNETDYAYDSNDNVIAIVEPQISTSAGQLRPLTLFAYDAYNNLIAYCDPADNANVRAWPNNLTCPQSAGAQRFSYTGQQSIYPVAPTSAEPSGELTGIISPKGYQTQLSYNASSQGGADFGQPTQIAGTPFTQFDKTTRAPTTTITYNTIGQIRQYDHGEGPSTIYYDTAGRVIQTTDPDGINSYQAFYPDGELASTQTASQKAAGVSTSYKYDLDRNVTSLTRHFTCTYTGGVTQCNYPDTTNYFYDGFDRLIETQYPTVGESAWVERYLYDLSAGAGNKTDGLVLEGTGWGGLYATQKNKVGSSIFFTQKLVTADAEGRRTSEYSYPPCPPTNRVGAVYCNNAPVATTYTYDKGGYLGLLTSTVDPLGHSISTSYDNDGNVSSVQFGGTTTPQQQYVYDPDARLASSNVGGLSESYTYDPDGNTATETSAENTQQTYTYYPDDEFEQLNLSSSVLTSSNAIGPTSLSAPELELFSYRPDGLPSTEEIEYAPFIVDPIGFKYTPAGRFTNSYDWYDQPRYPTRTRTYDQFGRAATDVIPAGSFTYSVYNLEDQPYDYSVRSSLLGSVNESVEDSRNQYGLVTSRFFSPNQGLAGGGNLWPTFQFAPWQGHLVQSQAEQWDGRTGTAIAFQVPSGWVDYNYDNASELTSVAAGSAVNAFAYDGQHRLISGTTDGVDQQSAACASAQSSSAPQ